MAGIHAVTVPRWGMTMTEGTICDWMAREGDEIALGQEIIEIETTKLTNVVEARSGGILRRIVLSCGITAPVGALAGVIADRDTPDTEIDAFIDSYADRMATGEGDTEAPPQPRRIELPGGMVNILETGPESDETVVLLHGFGGELGTWLFNQPALSASRRVVAMDLPGHGASDPVAGDRPLLQMLDRLEAAIAEVAPGPVRLVGHSLGGGLAAALAVRPGVRAVSVTLVAPVGLSARMDAGYLTDFVAAGRRREMKKALQRLFADPSKMTSDMIENVLRFKRLEGVNEALAAIAAELAEGDSQKQDILPMLRKLSCPALLLWGEEDGILPVPDAASLPDGVTLRVFAGAGHMPQMEAAEAVNAAILEAFGDMTGEPET